MLIRANVEDLKQGNGALAKGLREALNKEQAVVKAKNKVLAAYVDTMDVLLARFPKGEQQEVATSFTEEFQQGLCRK